MNIINEWKRTEVFIDEPSELFSYEIIWQKNDTNINYHVSSKLKDTCIPVFLHSIAIQCGKKKAILNFGVDDVQNLTKLEPYKLNSIHLGKEMIISLITDVEKAEEENAKGNMNDPFSFFYEDPKEVKRIWDDFIKDNFSGS